MRAANIESGGSRFRIVFVALDRFRRPSRPRHVIGNLNGLRARRLPVERKRLERYAVNRLRCIYGFARPGLPLRRRDQEQTYSTGEQEKAQHASLDKLLLGQLIQRVRF